MAITDEAPNVKPVEAIHQRLNEPPVAAAVVTLLDHADLLSTLVVALSEFLERSDTIVESVAAGVSELKSAGRPTASTERLPAAADLSALGAAVARSTAGIAAVLDSSMFKPEMVELLALVSDAATEGAERARTSAASVNGLRAALRALRDPEVGRGLGMLVEVSKSLGRHLADGDATGAS